MTSLNDMEYGCSGVDSLHNGFSDHYIVPITLSY